MYVTFATIFINLLYVIKHSRQSQFSFIHGNLVPDFISFASKVIGNVVTIMTVCRVLVVIRRYLLT